MFVELLVGLFGDVSLALCPRQFRDVFVRFLDEFLDFGAHAVEVEEFVVAFLDAFVYVGEVGAEAGYWFQDRRSGAVLVLRLRG